MNLFQKIHVWYLTNKAARKTREYESKKIRDANEVQQSNKLVDLAYEARDNLVAAGLLPIKGVYQNQDGRTSAWFLFLDNKQRFHRCTVNLKGGVSISKLFP